MKKCIIFGCGCIGSIAYFKLLEFYEVIAWADNDFSLWGKKKEDVRIIGPENLKEISRDINLDVIIAIEKYEEVVNQLVALEIRRIFIWKNGLLYNYNYLGLIPNRSLVRAFDVIERKNAYNILFVQIGDCIRTHKIANAVKKYGHKVYLMYMESGPRYMSKEYLKVYDGIFSFFSINDFVEFVNRNPFDIVHSSNAPDFLTVLMTITNKAVVHDCHDLCSAFCHMGCIDLLNEYIANVNSTGVIYVTEEIRKTALDRFPIPLEKTIVVENFISKDLEPTYREKKLSVSDGLVHCVYEGTVSCNLGSPYFFKSIWKRIASCGVHIHFYTYCNNDVCSQLEEINPEYIHYEGNLTSKELANEMSKYDLGLAVFDPVKGQHGYAEMSSPNKIYEYINAGIPVAIGNNKRHEKIVVENNFGDVVILNDSIFEQLKKISEIKILDHALDSIGCTMESQIPRLIQFYERCMNEHKNLSL